MRFPPLLCALIGFVGQDAHGDDFRPRDTQKGDDAPPSPQRAAEMISVPPGFQVALFAGEPDLRQPISMTLDDRGRLWVAESYSYKEWEKRGEDRIIIFEDGDGDGRFDSRKEFWDKGQHVSSIEVGFGGVWVIDVPDLLFIPDRDRDDRPDGDAEVKLTGFTLKASHNMANGLRWGPDGWLYGRHGVLAKSSVEIPGSGAGAGMDHEFDCAIWRYHPTADGGRFEVYCRGMTNPWGMDWNGHGDLFLSGNVNGHLWHGIRGARYDRMFGEGFFPHAYRRLGPCADHLHHAGDWGEWTSTRSDDGKGAHDRFGGGHSHCGLMIYRGDNWPAEYRGRAFLCNTHGRRVNRERLEAQGSGYVAKHEDDFLFANHTWFKGVEMVYGPDGGVYLSDWCDYGECHDSDGVHRSSGRIYKITYGKPDEVPEGLRDLKKLDSGRLAKLQSHANAFFASHARRILQERSVAAGVGIKEGVVSTLWAVATTAEDTGHRINALWALHSTGSLGREQHKKLRAGTNEAIAAWSLARNLPDQSALRALIAAGSTTPKIRLAIATGLPQLEAEGRFQITADLAGFEDDADDPNLPLMLWYAIEPIVPSHPEQALALARESKILLLTEFIARRLAHEDRHLPLLVQTLGGGLETVRQRVILKGMADGLAGLAEIKKPTGWDRYAESTSEELAPLIGKLDRLFNVPPQPELTELFATLSDNGKRNGAIRQLAKYDDPRVPQRLIAMFPNVVRKDQLTTLGVLTGRKSFAAALLTAIETGEFDRSELGAYHARQIGALGEEELNRKLQTLWGELRQPSEAKRAQIEEWKTKLTAGLLKNADRSAGRLVFLRACSSCHVLFGEGGKLGPDLTGGNRRDLHYLLENIIDPNALLPEDFRMTVLKLKDGRTVTGGIVAETERATTIRTTTDTIVVPKQSIAESETLEISTMPEGLLATLSDEEVADLVAYLRGKGPVVAPGG